MANTPKALSRSVLATGTTTLYTVPAATTTIVTNIVLSNTSGTAATATINFDGVAIIPTVSVPANSVVPFDLRQPLAATKLITGGAGTGAAIACHIAGVEQT